MTGFIKDLLADTSRWGSRRQPKIFISYRRRGEGAGYGGRVADKLVEHFGARQCFRDVDDIESGVDFVKTIREAVGSCEVLIAIIGPDWITQTDDKGRRRLDDSRDFVRLEVTAALERDIRVIPVLVGGADIPTEQELPDVLKALSRRQVHELTDTRWEYDVSRLVGAIETIGIRSLSTSKHAPSGWRWKAATAASIAGSLVLVAFLINQAPFFQKTKSDPVPPVVNREPSPSPQILPAKGESQADTFNRLDGRLRVTWLHQGVVYDTLVSMSGRGGVATVSYVHPRSGLPIVVHEDLTLLSNARGAFYVGSNPRLAGTSFPYLYTPDIFRLAPLRDGTWTITEVGDTWDHFDIAATRPFPR